MKFFKEFILLTFLIPFFTLAQGQVEFDIVFGSYLNDHANSTFELKERRWILNQSELVFINQAHEEMYSDTVNLKSADIESIASFIASNALNKTITKDLKEAYLKKIDWNLTISGNIKFSNETFYFDLKANSPSLLDADSDAQKFKKLENLFYKIIGDYK